MHIPNGTHVLIADGRKMLLFRNEGDAAFPNLRAVDEMAHDDPPDRELKSDAAGRTGFRSPGRTSTYVEADLHERAEARFAARTADRLNRGVEAGEIDRIIVVADPHTLGELRRHFGKALHQALIGEIAKDLVRHPVPDIERILSEA